jgi:polysaccharide pyruvyl transferase WcaK-like protein
LQLLRDWGLRGLKSCDPVFALAARFSTAKTRSKSKELSIGISLRRAGIIEEADLVQFADVIKRKIPARSNIVLLSLQPSEDKAVMDRLKSLLESEEFSIESVDAEMFQRPSEWFGVLNNLDLLIGMRLHALIMSLGMEVPCIGLSYDPKVTAVLNSFAQPYQKLDWAGNGKDLHFNVETLDKSIDDMLHQLDEQRSKIKVCLEEINALSCHNSQMLDAYLSQSG